MQLGYKNTMLSCSITLIWVVQLFQCFCGANHALEECYFGNNDEGPLLLTPLLNYAKIQEAQDVSRVNLQDLPNLISYSGFFTVNTKFNSNLFFWFFPAANGNKSAPVLLWLQGGPGTSLSLGVFLENGPFSIDEELRLKPRKYSWASSYSVLYIDSPLGAGYSFSDPDGYSTDEYQVGDNLYSGLVQFFTLFPDLQSNDFFVIGESYAGKFIPALCYVIHERNPTANLKINLKGLSIGNGWIDPISMLNYGEYLYQIGLLDVNGRDIFKQKEQEIIECIKQKQWRKAFDLFDVLIRSKKADSTIFQNLTGFTFYYNYLYKDDYIAKQISDIKEFLSSAEMRKTLHVGNAKTTFQLNKMEIFNTLLDVYMQSVKPWFEILVENYRVLLYNGQLDIRLPYSFTENFLETLCWSGAEEYKKAPRNLWYVGTDLAGYSKSTNNLTFLLVRNSGHYVPTDQPFWALEMISKFFGNESF